MPKASLVAGYVSAIVLGALAGFFVVFNSIFSDIFTVHDRLISYAVTIGVYAFLGFIFAASFPQRGTRWAVIVTLPAAVFVLVYTLTEPQAFLLHATFIVSAGLAAFLGAEAGAGIRKRRK